MVQHIEHLCTLICGGITKDDRGLSLIGLVDMVHLHELPPGKLLPYRCVVVSYWRRNQEPGRTIRQRLAFEYREDGTRSVLPGENEIVLNNRHLFLQITQIDQLQLGGYGQHMFVVQRQDGPNGDWVDAPPTAGLWIASDEMVAGIKPPR